MFDKNLSEIEKGIDVRRNLLEIKQAGAAGLKSERLYDISLFALLLKHEDPKVRKNAASIIGDMGECRLLDALYEGYVNEQTMFVKSAYLKAMSRMDYSPYIERLKKRRDGLSAMEVSEENLKHVADELKVLNGMLDDENPGGGHTFCNPDRAVTVFLSAEKSAVSYLLNDIPGAKEAAGGVIFKTADVGKISRIRIYRELFFPVNGFRCYERAELPKELASGNLLELLESLHREKKLPYRFRVTAKDMDLSDLGARIAALSKGMLINAPSDYEIELRLVKNKEGRYGCLLKLHTAKDSRFSYRKETVATSLKPQNAALMVRICADYLRPKARILDPFCGVGTLLVERAIYMRPHCVFGTDTFQNAILGARVNTKAAGMQFNYINRNFFDFKSDEPFDEIITEMPDIDKTEEEELYRNFFDKCSTLLAPRGIIIMNSDRKNLVRKHIRLNGELKLIREYVMNEKAGSYIWIIGR